MDTPYTDCDAWEQCNQRYNMDIGPTRLMRLNDDDSVYAQRILGGIADTTTTFLSDTGRVLNLIDVTHSSSSCDVTKPFYRRLTCGYQGGVPHPPPLVDTTDECTFDALKSNEDWGLKHYYAWKVQRNYDVPLQNLVVDCHSAQSGDEVEQSNDKVDTLTGKPLGCVNCVNARGQWGFADECRWTHTDEGSFECGDGGQENKCKVHLEAIFPSCSDTDS